MNNAPLKGCYFMNQTYLNRSFSSQEVLQRIRKDQEKRDKLYTPDLAIDYILEEPPIEVHTRTVGCDGGGGSLGHPKVYINLDPGVPQTCGYCGLRFNLIKFIYSLSYTVH